MDGLNRFLQTFFNLDVAARYWPDILYGMGITAGLGVAVSITGLSLGLALAIIRSMQYNWFSLPIVIFVDIMRALPPLVIIIIFFFAFPLIGLEMSAITATWLSLSMVLAAYAEESIWGGILSLPRGQSEAARSTGLSWWQTMTAVILPQAVRIALPPLTNRVIAVSKNVALGSVVALSEILNNAQSATSNSGNPTPLTMAALAYLAIFIPVMLGARRLEKRLHWRV
ncbi:MAG TPA: polar amino acid ABC transporter permease [Rhodospirillaceae bacterium]|nr:polar amino acid ABC transporter permease [Candidatus Neomarinimicrobiota bacterium]HCX15228.1 polar amino acid ABC transporter permease [Rhodospirillaceae bacterium]